MPSSEKSSNEAMAFDHNALGRIGGLEVIDIVGTVAIAWWLLPSLRTVALALVLGEVVHLAMKIDTPITQRLTA